MFLFAFGVLFEYILYFQPFILPYGCNPQTVSPFTCFLSEPLHKRNVIHAYMVMPFPVLVLFKRESCIFVTELSVELRRIEISFQPYLFQLAQLLGYPFREFSTLPFSTCTTLGLPFQRISSCFGRSQSTATVSLRKGSIAVSCPYTR